MAPPTHDFDNHVSDLVFLPLQQYLLTKIQSPLLLPVDENQRVPDTLAYKRCKGIRRTYHEFITPELFIDTCVENETPEKIQIYSFRKHFLEVFMNQTRKFLLTKGSSKRNFFLPMKKEDSFFSFPLFMRALINE